MNICPLTNQNINRYNPYFCSNNNSSNYNKIITECRNKNTINIDLLSTEDMIRKINNEDKKVALAVEKEIPNISKAVDIISKQLVQGGKLYYFGAGTSGRLGILDASECPPTFGVKPNLVNGIIAGGQKAIRNAVEGAEDNFEMGLKDAQRLTKKDVCVAISASGNPKYLLGVLTKANEKNCRTIALTCNPKGAILNKSEHGICVKVGPEAITGSSRMKAGTAQKMVLNMLSTGTMVKTGKTYENYMIDVMPTNQKLRNRAQRIVSEIAGVSKEKALDVLNKCTWKVKTAITMIKSGFNKNDADTLLKNNGGILRKALKSIQKLK